MSALDSAQGEQARLAFVAARDGDDGALAFARQTYRLYRAALRDRRSRYGRAFRPQLVRSCLVLRTFIRSMK